MENGFESLLAWKGVVVVAWLAALFAGERLLPAAREPAGSPEVPGGLRRLARNFALWAVNVAISPLIVLPLSLWASERSLDWRPEVWSGGLGLALDILLLDFLIYWWHRANHRIPLLWRFHEVHHLDRFLDTTTALRFHFGEVMLSALARAGIIMLLGFPFASVLAFEALVLIAALFHHSNLKLAPGLEAGLARVIITPSIHWVHHHAVRSDTDSNYGTIFTFWDPLFGSRSASRRHPEMVIGVERRGETTLPMLLARPFVGRRALAR